MDPIEQPIKITAEILQHDRSSCRFIVEKPLLPQGFVRFKDKERAKGSFLAERLFAIEGVLGVMIKDNEVTVNRQLPVDWRQAGPLVGMAIREHLKSGQPAVAEEALKNVSSEDVLRQKVQKYLDEQVNPAIASHGGTITLADVQGNNLYIQMGGGCQGCGMANVTLREGVETSLRQNFPEIGEILDITDHASGESPYMSSHYPER
jgi:Fe-S cluster biogenesis protein NfuA